MIASYSVGIVNVYSTSNERVVALEIVTGLPPESLILTRPIRVLL
jgi:hypothetical protein